MAKQNTKKVQSQKKQQPAAIPVPPALSPISSFRQQSIFIVLIGLIIYFNSVISHWEVRRYAADAKIPAADTTGVKKIIFNFNNTKWCIIPTLNKYALDDDIVMRLNDYVQQGFAGIGTIMTTDSYDSFFKSMGSKGELSGGRYRPLSIFTFAVEQQVFGECYGTRMLEVRDSLTDVGMLQMNPNIANKLISEKAGLEAKISQSHENLAMIRHIISVLLYILSVVLLLKLLRDYVFKYANLKFINHNDIAFITAIIFLVHPIHTEVVANVKSRDEIISFLFIVLTFIFVFKYDKKKESKTLFLGLLFYFFALLSKEWGITLMALIPMSFFIFRKKTIAESIKNSLPYIGIGVFYLMLRYHFVGAGKTGEITEVLNNPFVFATPIQKVATEIFVLIKYLRLLIFPHPLSADYSWKTIPYSSFGDALVWLSILVHVVIVYYMVALLKKRNWIAFAIAFYLSHLFLVSNLAMPIGATMGERLIYHSSLGFIMVAAFGLLTLLNRLSQPHPQPLSQGRGEETLKGEGNEKRKMIFVVLLVLLVVPMGYKTMARNPDWETDNILFMHDAWVVPNSVLANGNSGKAFIELTQVTKDTTQRRILLDSAIYHLDKAVTIHPKYVNGYLNLGLAFFQKRDLDKAEYYWGQARKYFPSHPFFRQSYDPALSNALVERAKDEGKRGNVPLAIQYISRALKYDSTNAEIWYHYGGANFSTGNINEAYRGWTRCLRLNPNHAEALKGMDMLKQYMNHQQPGKQAN
ncbi:MAG: DUF1736 domain-containing protein [Bacteroidetes bacterium]|nr:DUF1736 domain-containing protein [Bacteroidota bacterium]